MKTIMAKDIGFDVRTGDFEIFLDDYDLKIVVQRKIWRGLIR